MNMLGIIAGGGEAPKRLIAACQKLNRPFHVLAFQGQTDADIGVTGAPVTWLPLGAAGPARDLGREKGVKDVVMLGRVRRPSLSELKPDALMMQKLARIGLNALGDDGLLKAAVREIEAEGFRVVAPQDVFAELLMPSGQLGKIAPDEQAQMDIKRGVEIARALGTLDVGQSVIVQQGIVLAVEAVEGTDALIRRSASLRREGAAPVLVKMKKPQQDARFDLPSLGLETVREAKAAGLGGIAAEAGASLLIDREEVLRQADEAGLFVMGIESHG
ncbi:MAG TPA: UDP-2,3-diacylglucosamine diphosphatase LpxI [Alphaproteobacteria bacterium]|nr:UDP-2,3-diacylglucosamine diphosphatase LpxI [Alphaproteobacteria bacterium]